MQINLDNNNNFSVHGADDDRRDGEEETARQCISIDTATWDVELYVANAATIEATRLVNASNILERSCTLLLSHDQPDPRLARRVSRLAELFLQTQLSCSFQALCSYGALAPPHHASKLVSLYQSHPNSIHLALPAILAMPQHCIQLTPLVLQCILNSALSGDADAAALAATTLAALIDVGARPTLQEVGEAGVAARDAGLDEARRELASIMSALRRNV